MKVEEGSLIDMARKQRAIEKHFKEAFCGEEAKLLMPDEVDYKVNGIVEIKTGDDRGLIYVAVLTDVKKKD